MVLAYFDHHAAAWNELEQAGLCESAIGEQGLAAWNVLFGVNPFSARDLHANWLALTRLRSVDDIPLSGGSGLSGGPVIEPLWSSLQRTPEVGYQASTQDDPVREQLMLVSERRMA
ncbi:hypothetical protein D9M73_260610 [compost metagenome]